jgi:PEP-CTERM motif
MSASQSTVLTGSGLLAAMLTASAWAAPVAVPPGASDLPIPVFSGSTPTVTLLGSVDSSVTKNGVTVTLEEWAVDTSLNPGAVSIGFEILTSNTPTSLDATLHGYGGLTLSAESCDPLTAMTSGVCGTQTGTVSRSPGHGENLMFSSLGTMGVTPPIGPPVNTTNLYGIFSDASTFTHAPVQVVDDGKTFSFTGLAPKGTTGVPEPATFGLLGLGLLATLLARRREQHAAPG